MWLGGLYTDNISNSDADNDGQSMIVETLWLINQMSQQEEITYPNKDDDPMLNFTSIILD